MAVNDIGPRIGIEGEKEFKASIQAINAQMKALGAEMKAVTAEFAANANSEDALAAKNDVLGRSVDAARQKLATLDGQLTRQREALNELAAALEQAGAEFGQNSAEAAKAQNAYNQQFKAVANLEAQYNTARAQMAGFQSQMDGLGESADAAGKALSAQDVLAGVGAWSAIESGVRAVSAALQDAVATGMEFDAEISNLAATMGTTVDSLGDLRDFAQDIGASTVFTATQGVQGLTYLALAGKDAQESMEMLPTTMNLAAAGAMDLGRATDMVTDAQSALRLSAEQTNTLVDEMALTATKTNTSVGQLGEAILTVGGTAQFMAGGTAELNQVLGILADNSIKGSEGGTKLRNIILSLSSPTKDAAAQLDALGVSVFDAEGNMREFSAIFPELQRALSNLTSQEQIDALSTIFNNRDLAAAQALLGTTTERWDELAAAIDGAAGSAQRMAETRLDNLAGDITLLQSAADGAKVALSDSLTPALRGVTQAGTGIISFIGDAVKEFPLLGQAAAGLTAGVGALTLGFGAMSAASALGVTSIGALTTAIAASPVAPFALAVGAGVTALTALAHAADEAKKGTTELTQAIEENQEAYDSQAAASQRQRESVDSLISQLETLAAAENRTAGEKEQLLAVTEQLNQAVPGLGLKYDSLSDSLSMTTEQVLALAQAQMELEERQAAAAALVEARKIEAEVVKALEEAEEALAAAIERRDQAQRDGTAGIAATREETRAMEEAVREAQATVNALTQAVEDAGQQVEEMEGQLSGMTQAAEDTTRAAAGTGEQAASLAADLTELEESTLYAAGAADTLSDALKEQEKSGSLSLKTTNELIEAGYASAIAVDQETGAVTLNREEYVRLASAKIQDQIASLEAAKANLESKKALDSLYNSLEHVRSGYWDVAVAKASAAYAEDAQALDLQIAALNRAMSALNSYSGAAAKAASSTKKSASASKAAKTQAEQDLESYKTLKAALDHEQAMDLIGQEEYYRQLEELRDRYLTDDSNLSEFRKLSEQLHKYQEKSMEELNQEAEKALETREKAWQKSGENILKLEEDFQKQLSSRAKEIVSSYSLFEEVPEKQKVAGEELISNLENQISSIQEFYGNVEALAERGVSAALVEDIRAMGVKASDQLEALLELSDDRLTEYSNLYGEKQALANKLAEKELEGLRALTNEEILGQLDDVADLYDINAPALGLAFAENLAAGMFEGMGEVERMAQTVAFAAMSAFESTYNRDVEAMMAASGNRSVTRSDIGELLAGAVNGLSAGGGNVVYPPVDVTLTIDGQTLARQQVDPMRQAFKERPETLDDK